jgi:nitroreductase
MEFDEFKDLLMHQRAIRLFDTSKGVDDATVEQILRIATFAPNGGNRQPVRFLVIRDREIKTKLWEIFDDLGAQMHGGPPEATPWPEVPVLICVIGDPPPNAPPGSPVPASVYPAVQNILLTVHALGLGSVLTTRWKTREDEVRAILGYPEGVQAWAILPIGVPNRKYGRGKRRPVAEITYRDTWGKAWVEPIEATTGR